MGWGVRRKREREAKRETREPRKQGAKMTRLHRRKEKLGQGKCSSEAGEA